MAKKQVQKTVRYRRIIQLFWAAMTNSYVTGFVAGKIYNGNLKQICTPGLNCYSCPGALFSCPIGALQAVIGSRSFAFSSYVFGLILGFGALMGRMICGFLCPFGLVQELLYKIPFPFKKNKFRGDRTLRKLKYLLLIVLVILMPMLINNEAGQASPYFCKLVCPAGTLEAGIPHVLFSKSGRSDISEKPASLPALKGVVPLPGLSSIVDAQAKNKGDGYPIGFLFYWKLFILVSLLLVSVINYRPFCKYLCPLGAMYGLLNPVSLYRLRLDQGLCIHCGRCAKSCPMGVDPVKTTNHSECVRCGQCVKVCPVSALSMGFGETRKMNENKTVIQ